jgi:uncharacterized protein (DUF4213/DUF364 family)
MKIIEELLSGLDFDAPVRDIRQGPFQTAVLTANCGLASTPHDSGPHHTRTPIEKAGILVNEDARSLAEMVQSSSPSEAAIGMATINSLIKTNEQLCTEKNAADLLIEKAKNKKAAIIGHFPFVPRLREAADELWVIEQQPQPGDFAETEADRLLPLADVVGITGTTLINGTLEQLLGLCKPDAFVTIIGGTTPLSTIFFDYGVDAVAGTQVVEPETVLNYVSQGATFRQLKGVRKLVMVK